MTKNNKTHADMIREAVEKLGSAKPNSIMDFIRRKYPDIDVKETSFRADITGCCVNHSSSHHFPGMPKFLFFDTKNKTYRLDISEFDKKVESPLKLHEKLDHELLKQVEKSGEIMTGSEMVSFFVNGEPSSFSTAREKPWKIKLEQQIPDYNINGLERGVILGYHLESMTVNGQYFDVDNLCEPVFSILINKKRWFKGKRPNIQWFRASKIKALKSGCDFIISDSIEPPISVIYKNQIFNKVYSGKLPKSATDIEFISWIKENYTPEKNNGSFYLKIEFSSPSVNLGDIATGKIKSIIDCLYPIIGGTMGNPEDWRINVLEVKKGVETIPENSIRVTVLF